MTGRRRLGKVFVTGADGFIGSHLVERLVAEGEEVTALCLYNSLASHGWLRDAVSRRLANLRPVLGDVRDAGLMEKLIAGHDTVFHLASLIAIPYSYDAPQSYIDTNVTGALRVSEACIKGKAGRLIHTSTSEVYGSARYVPIDEAHPLQGQSPYSASKIGADMVVESFFRSFQLPAVTLRPFNTYGPRQSLRAVIPTIIAQLLAGVPEIRLGNLRPTRDFNFVLDTVEAFISLAKAGDEVVGNVYNAGSGREISVEDTVRKIAAAIGVPVRIIEEHARVRPGNSEVERLLCSSERLRNATGWAPRYTLEQGLSETVEWMRAHADLSRSSEYHK